MSAAQRRDQFLLAFLCELTDGETARSIPTEGLSVAIRAVEQRLPSIAKRYSYLNGSLKLEAIANDLANLREHGFIEIRDEEILLTESGISVSSAFDLPQAWEDLLDTARSALQRKMESA